MTTDNTSISSPIELESSWLRVLEDQFELPYMQSLERFLSERKQAGIVIYPDTKQWFTAFNSTAFEQVKVVILGQDPYHGPGQAHGLCFSVLPGVPVPPSLKNIFKELHSDLGLAIPGHGYLQHWADQGVLLLNATLTVEQGAAGAHQDKGWESFTDRAIALLNEQREGLVFMLWGSYAQKKGQWIDEPRHRVLKAPHPSPLSAYRGFLGCQHFSQANAYLRERGESIIDWRLSDS